MLLDADDLIAAHRLGLADAGMSPREVLEELSVLWTERAALVALSPALLTDGDLAAALRGGHRTEAALVDDLELRARRAIPQYRLVTRADGTVALEFDPAALGPTIPADRLPPAFRAEAEAARRRSVLADLAWRGPQGFSLSRVAACRGIARRTLTLWRAQERDRHDAQNPPRSLPTAA